MDNTIPTRLWIDTDTASDDAVALMLAFAHARERIAGVSTVAGNAPVEQATVNASYIARLCDCDLPIHRGASAPLRRDLETAQHIHGQDGMGDIGLALGTPNLSAVGAVEALIAAARAEAGKLELITLGPLTNIALAMRLAPEIWSGIERITIMGGTSDYYGNVTPVSEYNLWADPEAADLVFRSTVPKLMVGWDISRKFASVSDREAEALLAIGTDKARVAVESQAVLREFCRTISGVDGFDLPDPIAVAAALRDELITKTVPYSVSVCCNEGPTRGMTILSDRHSGEAPPTTLVAVEADRSLFLEMLREALS